MGLIPMVSDTVVDDMQYTRENASVLSNEKKGERMEVDPIESQHEAELLAEFERRRRARTLMLPTDDVQVKLKLRKLNQPICLFGEDILDRRERLRALLSTMTEDEVAAILHTEEGFVEKPDEETTTWYHRGPAALRVARVAIADFSLRRAKERLIRARLNAARPPHEKALARQEAHKWIQQLNLHASQVADSRPVAYCEFAPDSEHIDMVFLWMAAVEAIERARYEGRVMCVDISPDGKWIMSSAFDRTFKLWTQSEY
ncbi:WD domain, G-beta repeat protein [Teladorsagia circumcincta]|uniref:WD domain, G-beta repeat protein n=1 Tax=Teladorsagia circumcincta TaxID=45464 RepID=A0A2G9TZB6_TELCI|nr:WD domain, G-beta repeat protein [Teladorsagia circumcincta]